VSEYLYGASVQGIQEFIFETNKLQEIIGASEIVKSIESDFEKRYKPKSILVKAAGNIKAVFDDEEELKRVLKEFLKSVKQKAYGITISQAVVKFEGDYTQDDINKLEKRLKEQRNKPEIPLDLAINIHKLSQKTSRPAVEVQKKEFLSKASSEKREAYSGWFKRYRGELEDKDEKKLFEKFKEISAISNANNKIAIIHADGNGLGQLIPKLIDAGKDLSEFSKDLDKATNQAYNDASEGITKIRKIILGGDDMVAICDGDEALGFVQRFLENFEKYTKDIVAGGLTACAGISFSNQKFPFHYGVALAEELCSQTKKHAKKIDPNRAPSSLMFHNIQSSSYQSWEKFVDDELSIQNDKEIIKCDFGPYYLNQSGQPLISDFIKCVDEYSKKGSPISKLRNWLSELYKSDVYSKNLLERINEVANSSEEWSKEQMDSLLRALYSELSNKKLIVEKDGELKTPIYDVLQILSVKKGKI